MRPRLAASALLVLCVLLVAGCGDDEEDSGSEPVGTVSQSEPATTVGAGVITISSEDDVDAAFKKLVSKLEANPDIIVVAEVDHTANARGVGEELPEIREVIFGNPTLGTPLMASSPSAGIDLPQKVLVYEDAGDVRLAYNDPAYIASRHRIDDAQPTIEMIAGALGMLVGEGEPASPSEVGAQAGLITTPSPDPVDESFDRLVSALESNPDIKVVAEVDHTANASGVGEELPEIREVIFGNPKLGTPLMQEQAVVGLDLPQKILVYETADGTQVAYNDPAYVADRGGVSTDSETVDQISAALKKLSGVAAGS
ncbi:MAG: DUF302 domain-containing protein [Solirubrobacteraceae bacterium]